MTEFIVKLIGNDLLATLVMSLVPLIELKGGIVFARACGLDFITAFLLAYAGSTLVFFPIYFLLKPILPENDLESPSSMRLEAQFAYYDSRAITHSPSPHARRPDVPSTTREAL